MSKINKNQAIYENSNEAVQIKHESNDENEWTLADLNPENKGQIDFNLDENKMKQLKVEEDQDPSQNKNLQITKLCEKNQVKSFTCIVCGTGFTRKYNLNLHVQKNHDGRRESCEICNKDFFEKHEYDNHPTVCKEMEILKCENCDDYLEKLTELPKHMKEVHGEDRPFKCNICSGSFTGSKI